MAVLLGAGFGVTLGIQLAGTRGDEPVPRAVEAVTAEDGGSSRITGRAAPDPAFALTDSVAGRLEASCSTSSGSPAAYGPSQPWMERARILEHNLPLRAFLRDRTMSPRALEELLGASWVVGGVADLEVALASVKPVELLEVWRLEAEFWRRLTPAFKGRPPSDAPFAERRRYHVDYLSPTVRSEAESLCRDLGLLGLPARLIEKFRERIRDDY